ncbi:hypothetical protein GCM10012275_40830 [Longimycelium tulufanense]|uniref:CopG family transcriptional regulator n=1 Tax=Longimycelium tulufanense TaxID=907463 RepID=A0A8J3CH83_9PSEU|nr:DUF6364 family protein [Longimycelium tulufanense]GGM66112.1 hypothetical protein GCM10012275_40830 [Longimycelium tulufanense]
MSKQNVTIQLDEEVIQLAKVVAAKRGTSLSRLLAQQVTKLATAEERCEQAREVALKAMDEAIGRGGRHWRREDLYDRW